MTAEGAGAFRPVKSADRTLDVLEALAVQERPRTLAELARDLDIPKSSLHGLLRTLMSRGWVQSDEFGQRFRVGLRAVQLAGNYLDHDWSLSSVRPVLDSICEQCGETVQHARLDGVHIVYLAKRSGTHPVQIISSIGSRLPAHCTALGKALLAELGDDELDRLLEFPLPSLTTHSLTTRATLYADLQRIRERGYALDNEEAAIGLYCFAVTVPFAKPATDAISISVPAFRLSDQRRDELVRLLLDAQQRLAAGGS